MLGTAAADVISQALQEHSARQLRLMFLLQPWDKPMNYSDQTVSDAKSKESLFKNFFGEVKALQRSSKSAQDQPQIWTNIEHELNNRVHETQEKVASVMTMVMIVAVALLFTDRDVSYFWWLARSTPLSSTTLTLHRQFLLSVTSSAAATSISAQHHLHEFCC